MPQIPNNDAVNNLCMNFIDVEKIHELIQISARKYRS